jgi:hypothetical protein
MNSPTPLTKQALQMFVQMIEDEHARLAALSAALEYWTSPKNGEGPDGCQNPTARRLAQLLDERLNSTEHLDRVRHVLNVDFGGRV